MSEQQIHYHKEAALNQALAGLVRYLAQCVVEDYLAETKHPALQRIPRFVLDEDKRACSAPAHNARDSSCA